VRKVRKHNGCVRTHASGKEVKEYESGVKAVEERRSACALGPAARRPASVAVTCGSHRQPAVGELFLDARPWRDVVGK
jgi:hypothetical protein